MLSGTVEPWRRGETKFIFFSGKGGAGKSTIACATSVYPANRGFRAMTVTTDPASHLQAVFGQPIESEPAPIKGVDGPHATRIDLKPSLKFYGQHIRDLIMDQRTTSSGDMR